MVKTRNSEVEIMSRKLNSPQQGETINMQRYSSPEVVDHLASNYVMGLLSPRVKKRVETLRRDIDYRKIEQRISFWEQKLSPLNEETPELAPLPETWQHIQNKLNMGQTAARINQQKSSKQSWWSSLSLVQWSGVFSFVICAVIGFALVNPFGDPSTIERGALSYVAVLEDNKQTPQVVAATYGNSKQLVLDIISLPDIDAEESYELWVTSKTDNQTRSLGEIPKGQASFDRALSDAEWRLIADSSYLIISVEDEGGSAIGEPSITIISRGLCIRLADRDNKTQV